MEGEGLTVSIRVYIVKYHRNRTPSYSWAPGGGTVRCVNTGGKMHRRTEVKMHHAGPPAGAQLSSSIDEPAFPSRPGEQWPRRAA